MSDAEIPSPTTSETAQASEAPSAESGTGELQQAIVEVLKTVYDPEIPVDIYELGLIYEVTVRDGGRAYVRMTLTTPACPAAELLPPEVEEKVRSVDGVSDVELELVWDPPWSPAMMSEAARLTLNL